MDKIYIAGIIHNDSANGPGLRCTIFTQGCCHACHGCHSPHTWAFKVGTEFSAESLIEEIERNPLDKAITWSGGDPLCQLPVLLPVMEHFAQKGYDQLLYTGYSLEELNDVLDEKSSIPYFSSKDLRSASKCLSTFILDPFVLEQRSLDLRFRGSKNQRVATPVWEGEKVHLTDMTTQWDAQSLGSSF